MKTIFAAALRFRSNFGRPTPQSLAVRNANARQGTKKSSHLNIVMYNAAVEYFRPHT
jgi:hypothetical protein